MDMVLALLMLLLLRVEVAKFKQYQLYFRKVQSDYINFVMSESICACHCGTRIVVDQQLLQERQTWKQKYICLQKQAINDIGKLKQTIYAECSALMQKQFSSRQNQNNAIINQKNIQIKSLTTRVINVESKGKVLEKQNQILRNKTKQLEDALLDKENIIQNIRSRGNKSQRDWQVKLQEEITIIRKKITLQYQNDQQKLQAENEHLKHKVRQFEKKYQIIIPEVQKLKNSLNSKNQQIQQLESRLQKIKRENETYLLRTKQESDQVDKIHSKDKNNINKLSEKVESLTQQLQIARKVKKEVKIEPVYIERPVEVQRIVEKIVQIEKIVNKYIEPTTYRDQQLELQIKKLKEDNILILNEFHLLEQKYHKSIKEYEGLIHQLQENETKYKKQREELAKRLLDQDKEMDSIYAYIQKRKYETQLKSSQPEKITIHVNKDGKYQKVIEKVASQSNLPTQANTRIRKR